MSIHNHLLVLTIKGRERESLIGPHASGQGAKYVLKTGAELELYVNFEQHRFLRIEAGHVLEVEAFAFVWLGADLVSGDKIYVESSSQFQLEFCEVKTVIASWNESHEAPARLQSPENQYLMI